MEGQDAGMEEWRGRDKMLWKRNTWIVLVQGSSLMTIVIRGLGGQKRGSRGVLKEDKCVRGMGDTLREK